ncbi:MAG: hypothetical protein IT379_15060 [Deltaproteobacteria bacterium]|nr:hypothetical protein [Deltaproteobacteria bacterium]
MTNIIPRRIDRPPLLLTTVGANRGARASQGSLLELFRDGHNAYELEYVDPVPGRAASLARVAEQKGALARFVESRIEDAPDARPALRIFQADRASATASALERDDATPATGFIIVGPPGLDMIGVRFALGRNDPAADRVLAAFRGLAAVSSREGSHALLGAEAPVENRLVEGAFRNWYGAYLRRNAAKLAIGLEPEGPTMEATHDGLDTRPVFVIESDELEPRADRVAERVAAEATFPLRRDSAFLTIEIARIPEPMVRFRPGVVRRDRMVQVGRARDLVAPPPVPRPVSPLSRPELGAPEPTGTSIAPGTDEPFVPERSDRTHDFATAIVQAIGLALASGPQSTATRTNPIMTTD